MTWMNKLEKPDIYYCQPVFRPPSEAYSLLIQATIGCTYHCTFCVSNLSKKFAIRPVEDIKKDIRTARDYYGTRINRIFFLNGNAMVIPTNQLEEITRYAYELFPTLERVGVYAHAEDILVKTPEELSFSGQCGFGNSIFRHRNRR